MNLLNKIFAVCCIVLASCATTQHREGSISTELENIYLSSVTVSDSADSQGSGTIIYNKAGEHIVVLTAAHVVEGIQEDGKKIYISTGFDKINREMSVYKIDFKLDLALLRGVTTEKRSGPFVKISTQVPNIGDDVWVIGCPMGADRTVTKGIISNFAEHEGKTLYRTTADIYDGNSGGGMFNKNKELIGVAHGVLEVRRSMFFSQLVPGGFFFVGLENIRQFM